MGTIMKEDWTICSNRGIALDTWEMKLTCSIEGIEKLFGIPGRFVNLKIDGVFLRRPISVCQVEGDTITLIYRIVGKGTALLVSKETGDKINLLFPLGNGFDTDLIPHKTWSKGAGDRKIVLIGGGVGLPPLYGLAKKLVAQGKTPDVIMMGVEFVTDKVTKEPNAKLVSDIVAKAVQKGLVLEAAGAGNVIRFLCPLCVTDAQLTAGLDIFEEVLKESM